MGQFLRALSFHAFKGIIAKDKPNLQLEISDDDSFAKLQAGAVNGGVRKSVSKQLRQSDQQKDMSYAVTNGNHQS